MLSAIIWAPSLEIMEVMWSTSLQICVWINKTRACAMVVNTWMHSEFCNDGCHRHCPAFRCIVCWMLMNMSKCCHLTLAHHSATLALPLQFVLLPSGVRGFRFKSLLSLSCACLLLCLSLSGCILQQTTLVWWVSCSFFLPFSFENPTLSRKFNADWEHCALCLTCCGQVKNEVVQGK